jgi:hypothetical protein
MAQGNSKNGSGAPSGPMGVVRNQSGPSIGYEIPEGVDPLDYVTYERLAMKNEEHTKWAGAWENYRLLYRGGEEFLRACGQVIQTRATSQGPLAAVDFMAQKGRRRRFLHQLEGEPETKYVSRWERAFYIGYLPAILNYFRHWLFSQPPSIRIASQLGGVEARASKAFQQEAIAAGAMQPESFEAPDAPDWWETFAENCTGGGTSFIDFMKDVFLDVLVCRRAGWLIGRPQLDPEIEEALAANVVSEQQAEQMGLNNVLLTPYSAEEIIDWQRDAAGELLWVVLKKETHVRIFPNDREIIEVYTYVDRNQWRMWRCMNERQTGASARSGSVASGSGTTVRLEQIGQADHDLGVVPFVMFEIPHDLWMSNALASWQTDLFNRSNMLKYGQLLACYPQPYLRTNDDDAQDRVLGEGIILHLRSGNTQTGEPPEEFDWKAPSTEPFNFVSEDLKSDRDEGYRIVHQMSLAVDATVMGVSNSGKSKQEDRRASEIILAAFGGYIRQVMVKTLNTISKFLGDGTEWVVDGFDNFQVSSLDEELQTAALVSTLQIPSPTFKRELMKSVATGRVLGKMDELTRETIRQEIDEAVKLEEEAQNIGGGMAPTDDGSGNPFGAADDGSGGGAPDDGSGGNPFAAGGGGGDDQAVDPEEGVQGVPGVKGVKGVPGLDGDDQAASNDAKAKAKGGGAPDDEEDDDSEDEDSDEEDEDSDEEDDEDEDKKLGKKAKHLKSISDSLVNLRRAGHDVDADDLLTKAGVKVHGRIKE